MVGPTGKIEKKGFEKSTKKKEREVHVQNAKRREREREQHEQKGKEQERKKEEDKQ